MEFIVELLFSLFFEITGYAPTTGKNRVKRFSPYFWLLVLCEIILGGVTFLFILMSGLLMKDGFSFSLGNLFLGLVLLAVTAFFVYRFVYLTVSLITILFAKKSAS